MNCSCVMQTTPTQSLSVWLSFEVMVVENVVLAFTAANTPFVAMISLAKILSIPLAALPSQAIRPAHDWRLWTT